MTQILCRDSLPPIEVPLDSVALGGWCEDPIVPDFVDGSPLVVSVCRDRYDLSAVQSAVRRAGFDPFGVEIVELDTDDEPLAAEWSLAAAIARAAVFQPGGPEHVKTSLATTISRRALFRMQLPVYRSAPHPSADLCVAADGCRACVDVCPHGALHWSSGEVQHDRVACLTCGRCVTECPTGAMVNPAITPAMLTAEVDAVAAVADPPDGMRFVCSRGPRPGALDRWHDVRVPCVGMVPPHWLLVPLLRGVPMVAIAECGCGVEFDASERATGSLAFARRWLAAAGRDAADHLPNDLDAPVPTAILPASMDDPFGPLGATEVALAIGATARIADDRAPLGLVEIDEATCTGCERCAATCPTNALSVRGIEGGFEIDFDPGVCVACGQCVDRCPESERAAIRMDKVVDTSLLQSGAQPLVRHEVASCRQCGNAIAPVATLRRVEHLLSDDDGPIGSVTQLCLDCRSTRMIFS